MDAHTLRHEQAAISHSLDMAARLRQYHEAGIRNADDRTARLHEREAQIVIELETATNDCDCT